MWQTHLVMDDELDEGEIDPARTAPDSPAKGMDTIDHRSEPHMLTARLRQTDTQRHICGT
jgi:hypothetical protein